MPGKWTSTHIEKLLEAYAKEENLYKVSHPNYHNRHVRKTSLLRILKSVKKVRPGSEFEEIPKKLHSLRNNFIFEHKKVLLSQSSGCGADEMYKPSLSYYEQASFLANHFVPRKSRSKKLGDISGVTVSAANTVFNCSTIFDTSSEHDPSSILVDHMNYTPMSSDFFGGSVILSTQVAKIDDADPSASAVYDQNSVDIKVECLTAASSREPANSPARPFSSASTTTSSVRRRNDSTDSNDDQRPHQLGYRQPSSPVSATSSKRRYTQYRPTDNDDVEQIVIDRFKENIVVPVPPPELLQKRDSIDSFFDFVGGILRKVPSDAQDDLMELITKEVFKLKRKYNVKL